MSSSVSNYADGLNHMAVLRFQRLAEKYTVETEDGPVNAGMFRDNVLDITEEITDIVNISGLLFERLGKDQDTALGAVKGLQLLEEGVNTLIAACYALDHGLPPSYRVESVDRVVTREEVGICLP